MFAFAGRLIPLPSQDPALDATYSVVGRRFRRLSGLDDVNHRQETDGGVEAIFPICALAKSALNGPGQRRGRV